MFLTGLVRFRQLCDEYASGETRKQKHNGLNKSKRERNGSGSCGEIKREAAERKLRNK